jgi:fructokinase
MYDVCALGELLIDFTPAGTSPAGNLLFERNPGGAPANVLAAVTRLGGTGAFIGEVGADAFGRYLQQVLEDNGIESRGLRFAADADTTLAFVTLTEAGDRDFSFYRRPGADTRLSPEDLDLSLISGARIFHFGSLSMTHEPARSATLQAAAHARATGRLVSYDPNWRPPLWESPEKARAGMELGLPFADILKISEVELEFLTGETDLGKGSRKLFRAGMQLLLVTLGPRGCYYRSAQGAGRLDTYDTRVVDTTGAGDAFLGGLLYRVARLERPLRDLPVEDLEELVDFSCAVGSLCTTKRGAIPAMPTLDDVQRCRNEVPRLEGGPHG